MPAADLAPRLRSGTLGGGLGGVALAHLLGRERLARRDASGSRPRPDFNGGLHHPAKVRRVVQLFMNGGVSQMDTFDHKPELDRRHGEVVRPRRARRGRHQHARAS